jgi:hypothetical protein
MESVVFDLCRGPGTVGRRRLQVGGVLAASRQRSRALLAGRRPRAAAAAG